MTLEIRNVKETSEGDGVDVKRLFPIPHFMNFDPFVLFDHFDIGAGRGFPEHPHRGFEAITYMFNGGMNHKDNLGNESFVEKGGAQRFTAGKGLLHSEMPANEGKSNGIQLWINLPKRLKQMPPSYQQVNDADFPRRNISGGWVKTIVGEGSPLELNTPVIYQHLSLDKGADYSFDLDKNMNGIVYLKEGEIQVNNQLLSTGEALFVEAENLLEIKAGSNSEFILFFGEPHKEPIHQHGPFVD